MTRRSHADDLRGAGRLAVEATRGVTDLVEAMHKSIGAGPGGLLGGLHPILNAPVYAVIRGVTSVVGAGLDLALARLAPLLGESAPGAERDAVLAALNGVLGDYLEETGNPLAIPLELRTVAGPLAGPRLLLLVHGSSMNERSWPPEAWPAGVWSEGATRSLRRDRVKTPGKAEPLSTEAVALGAATVAVRYNSGRHVSTNGRELAERLESLCAGWPELERIDIVAHSMGGLVARSACAAAEAAGHLWRRRVRHLVFLGTPHHGAPLERAGNWVDVLLGIHPHSAPLARLGKIRSAGVTDLRHGNVLDEHWHGRDRFAHGRDARTPLPLPAGVACHAVAGTLAAWPGGDGLVPVDSALGRHPRPELTLVFAPEDTFVAAGVGHVQLLRDRAVQDRVRAWLAVSQEDTDVSDRSPTAPAK